MTARRATSGMARHGSCELSVVVMARCRVHSLCGTCCAWPVCQPSVGCSSFVASAPACHLTSSCCAGSCCPPGQQGMGSCKRRAPVAPLQQDGGGFLSASTSRHRKVLQPGTLRDAPCASVSGADASSSSACSDLTSRCSAVSPSSAPPAASSAGSAFACNSFSLPFPANGYPLRMRP